MAWGNDGNVPREQQMVSPAGKWRLEVTDIDSADSALKATNSDGDGLALEVAGKTYLNGQTEIEDNLTCDSECHVTETLYADGEANVTGHLNCEDDVDIDGQLAVGPAAAAGEIDSGGNAQDLKIDAERYL